MDCLGRFLASSLLLPALFCSAAASAQENFYAGKRINLVLGGAAGSGLDAYARLLAHHMGRHIPGNPTIVVQNLPGAASLTAVNTLESTAPKDGTTMVMFNAGLLLTSVTNPEEVKVDFSNFPWLGSMGQTTKVCYMWGATGVKTWEEMIKKDPIRLGDTGGVGPSFVMHRVLQKLYGAKIQSVRGYSGAGEQKIAIERGELDGDCPSWASIPTDWIRDKKINILVRFTTNLPPEAPPLPYARDLLKDPVHQKILDLVSAPDVLGRPFIVSKSVPQDRLQILREAFSKTLDDPQFLADAEKQGQPMKLTSAADAERIVKDLSAAPPEVVSMVREMLAP